MWVCRILKKKVQQGDIQEKERAAKRELLRQKKIAKRENCAWRRKQKEEYKVLPPLREIICVCERANKIKRDFSLVVRHTQELL